MLCGPRARPARSLRELLLGRAHAASAWRQGFGALFVFPLVPIALLTAMVLMLRVVRPSLPYLGQRNRPESMIQYLASVLVPFLSFYLLAGYFAYDGLRYGYAVAAGNLLSDGATKYLYSHPLPVAIVAAVAFGLRWALGRLPVFRTRPWLGLPAAYLEVLWVYTLLLLTYEAYRNGLLPWLAQSRIGVATLSWWHTKLDTGQPVGAALQGVRSIAQAVLDSGIQVVAVPATALVVGSVVLAARISPRRTDQVSGLRLAARVVGTAGRPVASRLLLISDGVRRVFQAGVVATMIFCLLFVAVGSWSRLLNEPERVLVGPADVKRVWEPLFFPFQWLNQSVALVLLMCLIAAFVDRTASRIAHRATTPVPMPDARPARAVPAARVDHLRRDHPELDPGRRGTVHDAAGSLRRPADRGWDAELRRLQPGHADLHQLRPAGAAPRIRVGTPLAPPPGGPSAVPPPGLLSRPMGRRGTGRSAAAGRPT